MASRAIGGRSHGRLIITSAVGALARGYRQRRDILVRVDAPAVLAACGACILVHQDADASGSALVVVPQRVFDEPSIVGGPLRCHRISITWCSYDRRNAAHENVPEAHATCADGLLSDDGG